MVGTCANGWLAQLRNEGAETADETAHERPTTGNPIPVVLCSAPSVRTETLSTKKQGLDANTDRGLTERIAEVFVLDILSHGMSDMAMLRQLGNTAQSRPRICAIISPPYWRRPPSLGRRGASDEKGVFHAELKVGYGSV